MTDKLNSINSSETTNTNKYNKFVKNTKEAVRKVLMGTGIVISTLLPITSAELLTACSDGGDATEVVKDTTPPTINLLSSSIDITGGKEVRISGNQLYIGSTPIASRSDETTKNCKVELSINGKPVTSGTTISEEGTLTIKVTDAAGNTKNASLTLNINNAPEITVDKYEINIFGGAKINISDNKLMIGDETVASRKDESGKKLTVSLNFNGQPVKSGDTIDGAGKLSITITNEKGKSSSTEITVTNDAIYGLETLKNASMKVDQEINLLNGISFANGVELVKTEIEIDGKRSTITDPSHYTPQYPGTCNIIFTVQGKNGETTEIKVDNLTIKPLDYKAIQLNNINPVDILPIIGQVEAGDKNAYNHIEHLRIAEATRIRDMMWKYGAGNHSPEEYQQLMMRLKTGMTMESPKGYDNYEIIGGNVVEPGGTNHAHDERNILNNLVNHAKFYVVDPTEGGRRDKLYEFVKNNPNSICIFGNSSHAEVDKGTYESRGNDDIKNLCKSKNFLIFVAGGNISTKNGILRNKIYHEDVNGDEHGLYSLTSSANGKNDASPDRHLIVSVGTDADGDIDQTNEIYESSKFPVGFHKDVLFAGRTFPRFKLSSGKIVAETGKYPTSYVNYLNVAIADLIFQMKADIANVDELLTMIRSSTNLKDHIKFNGEDQPLILMDPAGFFKKYLMPNNLPSNIQSSKTVNLNKGYYKGVVFDIPGAEVKISGEWIAYNDANKPLIKNQNPMTLEWRLNGDLCKKLGYKGKDIQGKIIVVDDKWNGLNIDKDFSISIL